MKQFKNTNPIIFTFIAATIIVTSCLTHEQFIRKINKNIHLNNCNYVSAKQLSDSLFTTRFKYYLNDYRLEHSENDSSFIFRYHHKIINNIVTKGGGGEIIISKKNCKLINIIGYQ
jgi:hypothetical protein